MAESTSLNVVVKLTDQASAGLKSFAKNVEGIGDKLDETTNGAKTFTKAVTGVGLAVGGYALAKFSEFEKTMSGVKAVLSPTGEEFTALSDKVKQLGKDTAFSQGEIARTTEDLAKNGLNAQQILGGALDATANFAAAAGTNLETAGNVMSDAMNIFGLATEDAATAVDMLTGVTIASKFGAEDLSLALAQGGGVAKAVGVSFSDFTTTIAAVSNSFASGSDAGTSFKTFLQRLAPTSAEAEAMMKDLGFSAYDLAGNLLPMKDIAQRLQNSLKGLSEEEKNLALTTMFGSDSMRVAAAIADQGAAGFDKYADSIAKVDAGAQAKTRMDNFSGSLEKLMGTVDVLAVNLGEKIGKTLRPMIDGLANALEDMGKWWNSLSPAMQRTIEITGTVVAGIAALLFVVGALAIALAPVLSGIAAVAGALSFLATVASVVVSAIAAVVAAIGAPVLIVVALVTAAVYGLYRAWEENLFGIRDVVKAAVDSVVGFFTTLWTETVRIFGEIGSALSSFWEGVKTAFEIAAKVLLAVVVVLLDGILRLFGTNLAEVVAGVLAAWNLITDYTSALWAKLSELFAKGTAFVSGVFSTFWNATAAKASEAGEWVSGHVRVMWDGLSSMFSEGSAAIGKVWDGFTDGLAKKMEGAWNSVKDVVKSGINWIIDKTNSVIASINAATSEFGFSISPIAPVKFQTGGVVPGNFQTGGIVSGGKNPADHDRVPAMLDPGELILNRSQQSNLADQIRALSETRAVSSPAVPDQFTTHVTVNFGGLTIASEADADALVKRVKDSLVRELQLGRKGLYS